MTASLLGNASLRGQAALGTASAFVTSLLLVPIYGLTKASLGVPFFYRGDANFHGMLVKGVLKHGWYYENPLLSAPAGQRFRDFPMPDNLHLAIIRALGVATDSYAVAMNLYFLAGFALTAFFTTLLLRRLSFSPIASVSIGILYALAPYHFSRNENHLFLASYWTVAFSIYLAMGVLGHVPLFPRRDGAMGRGSRLTWTGAATVAMAVLVASGSGYYGIFTAIILAAASMAAIMAKKAPELALSGLILILVVLAAIMANLSPMLLYAASSGGNEEAVVRSPGSGEYFGLKLTQLILPMQEHRLSSLGSVTGRYLREFPLPSESHPLGAVAVVGLVAIMGGLLFVLARPRAPVDDRLSALILFTVVALLVAVPGGFSSLLELLVTPVLRGWNRLSIFIMLFALMYLGLLFDRAYLRADGRRRGFFAGLCALVTIFGVWDQTSDQFRPDYAGNRVEFLSDREFIGRLEATLPPGSMVFQLPAIEFPEAGSVAEMVDYDHLRAFLHSDHLRWSYGGVRGRVSADWPAQLDDEPAAPFVAKLAAVGYRGIYIDRYGYADRAGRLEAELSTLVGSEPIVSRHSRLSFFDIQAYGRLILKSMTQEQVQALRRSALEPISAEWGSGFHGEEGDGDRRWRWTAGSAALTAEVPGGKARQVIVSFAVAAPAAEMAMLRIDAPGHPPREIAIGSEIENHSVELLLQPGLNRIVFSTDAPAGRQPGEERDLRVQLFDLRVDDAEAVRGMAALRLAA